MYITSFGVLCYDAPKWLNKDERSIMIVIHDIKNHWNNCIVVAGSQNDDLRYGQ